jgi:hypothetical protein
MMYTYVLQLATMFRRARSRFWEWQAGMMYESRSCLVCNHVAKKGMRMQVRP